MYKKFSVVAKADFITTCGEYFLHHKSIMPFYVGKREGCVVIPYEGRFGVGYRIFYYVKGLTPRSECH